MDQDVQDKLDQPLNSYIAKLAVVVVVVSAGPARVSTTEYEELRTPASAAVEFKANWTGLEVAT